MARARELPAMLRPRSLENDTRVRQRKTAPTLRLVRYQVAALVTLYRHFVREVRPLERARHKLHALA